MSEEKKLIEVWKWKEDVYEKTRNMTRTERISFFNKGLEDLKKRITFKVKETIPRKADVEK
ncbi:MAG: hypothetical protein AB1630_06880 [bacterium]